MSPPPNGPAISIRFVRTFRRAGGIDTCHVEDCMGDGTLLTVHWYAVGDVLLRDRDAQPLQFAFHLVSPFRVKVKGLTLSPLSKRSMKCFAERGSMKIEKGHLPLRRILT